MIKTKARDKDKKPKGTTAKNQTGTKEPPLYLIDELDHIAAEICFMEKAVALMMEESHQMNEQTVFGSQLFHWHIEAEIRKISKQLETFMRNV